MKQVKYFCNLCAQEIVEGSAGFAFQKMQSLMGQGISITHITPFRRGEDLHICQRCAETIQGVTNKAWPPKPMPADHDDDADECECEWCKCPDDDRDSYARMREADALATLHAC